MRWSLRVDLSWRHLSTDTHGNQYHQVVYVECWGSIVIRSSIVLSYRSNCNCSSSRYFVCLGINNNSLQKGLRRHLSSSSALNILCATGENSFILDTHLLPIDVCVCKSATINNTRGSQCVQATRRRLCSLSKSESSFCILYIIYTFYELNLFTNEFNPFSLLRDDHLKQCRHLVNRSVSW